MSKTAILLLGAAAGLGVSFAWNTQGSAEGTSLAVKPGLWEMTTASENSGMQVPPEALANMTPEQRTQFEAMMKAHSGKQPPHVFKHCLTEKQLKRGFTLDKAEKECKKTVVANTSKVLEVHVACADPQNGLDHAVGDFHFQAIDAGTIAGTTNMTMTNGGRTMTMKSDMHGKWLSPDCGDIKPPAEDAE